MADRFTIIANLGSLQSKLRRRGDDRAAALVQEALELIVSDTAAVDRYASRKASDAARQRNRRGRSPDSHVRSRDMSRDSLNSHVTHVTPLSPPTPPSNPRDSAHAQRARARGDAGETEGGSDTTANLTERLLMARVGEDGWPMVSAFLDRRDPSTRAGWSSAMLADITGSPWEIADLVAVCRDDAAMDRPIATPKGLRVFLRSARDERLGSPDQAVARQTNGHTRKRERVSVMRGAPSAPSKPTDAPEDVKWQD